MACLSCETVPSGTSPSGESNIQPNPSRLRRSWSNLVLIAVIVWALTVVTTSVIPVSKLSITCVNYSNHDLLVRVWVDDCQDRATVLEPLESVSFSWDLTAGLHKYDILAHSPDILVMYYQSWTYFIVLPFNEKVITNEL